MLSEEKSIQEDGENQFGEQALCTVSYWEGSLYQLKGRSKPLSINLDMHALQCCSECMVRQEVDDGESSDEDDKRG